MIKEEILPLKEVTRIYISKCYELCGYNKTELAKYLNISIRTVRNYCQTYKLDLKRPKQPSVEEVVKPSKEFDCIQFVTSVERDAWYNRDYY